MPTWEAPNSKKKKKSFGNVNKLSSRGKMYLQYVNEISRNRTRSLARLSIARSSSVMGPSMCCCELWSCISFRDNLFVMDYVMCQVCHVFHLETMYYVEICTTYYVRCQLCFHMLWRMILFALKNDFMFTGFSFIWHVFHLETKNGEFFPLSMACTILCLWVFCVMHD
jgi:hypothetical protein